MNKSRSAFTLIEIMITLVVLIALTIMAVFTLSQYMPKQRLLDSVETVEQTVNRAQMEATSRSTWTCVKYDAAANALSVFVDTDTPFHGTSSSCGFGTDIPITTQPLRTNVGFAPKTNTNCTASATEFAYDFPSGDQIWFDSSGVPQDCIGGVCTPTSFSLIVTSSDLLPTNKAREIEVLTSGLIATIARGDRGYMTGVAANTGNVSGCE